MLHSKKRRIIVIGSGAAGMMAAIQAARQLHQLEEEWMDPRLAECEVLVLERNEKSGKKIYITGKGRCNLTNAAEMEEVSRQVIRNPKFLYSAFRAMDNKATMDFFQQIGLPIKVERGNRVFPESDKSSDVIRVLDREMDRQGVRVRYHAQVDSLLHSEEDGLHVTGVRLKSGEEIVADAVILATGGLSYASTGSTGDGYRFAGAVGHTTLPCRPSLVPFDSKDSWVRELQGLALKNISISLWQNDKKLYEEFGEMLFTHFGVSGPVILSASSIAGDALMEGPAVLKIDLKPAIPEEELDQRIIREMEENKNKAWKNVIVHLLPSSMVPVMSRLSGIEEDKKVNFVTREERKRFLSLLKGLPVQISGLRGYSEAVITKGGISVKEVNPKTMKSKKAEGLYLAGEVLDVDAMTGGYNLQIAWSTGYAAGKAAAEELADKISMEV